jgi:uncharacterized protein (TIGR01244 family)
MSRLVASCGVVVLATAISAIAYAQTPAVTKEAVPGIRNFARVETTVACAGATTPESMAEVRRMGFVSVINLRLATEDGANIEAERAAAETAGLHYVHVPFSSAAPDPSVVDTFLKAVADPANQPAFIHCASGNRAAAMWMAKRVRLDHWEIAKAGDEASALGLTSAPLRQFILDYLQTHSR